MQLFEILQLMCLVRICETLAYPDTTMANNELLTKLFEVYNNKVPPSTPVTINSLVLIDDLIEVNEKEETIKIAQFLGLNWQDKRLSWNPDNYANVTWLSVPCGDIWLPDIRLNSVIDRAEIIHDTDVINVMFDFNGYIRFVIPEIFTVRCPMELRSFPFDKQSCLLMYQSLAHTSSEIILQLPPGQEAIYFNQKRSSNEWIATKQTAESGTTTYHLSNYHLEFSTLNCTLNFKRASSYYLFVIIIPTMIISGLQIIGTFMPFCPTGQRQEKITLGITTLLTMTVMLQLVADSVPKSSQGLPLLGQYVFVHLSLSALVTLISIITIAIQQRALSHQWNIPNKILIMTMLNKMTHMAKAKMSKKDQVMNRFLEVAGREPSSQTQEEIKAAMINVKECVREIETILKESKMDEERESLWNLVMNRIDLFLLIVSLIADGLVTAIVMHPAYLHHRDIP